MISLLDIAELVLPGGSTFSIKAAAQRVAKSPDPTNENFQVLPMDIEGFSDYRADRFRIYFSHPQDLFPLSVSEMVLEFGRIFPQLFNGTGNDVNRSGLTQNVATTFYRFDKPFNGEPALQFEFDGRVLFDRLDITGLHDDWAGFVHQDPNLGFAAQSLRRLFAQPNDVQFQIAVQNALLLPGLSSLAPVIGAINISLPHINRYHFLSGRRSWVIRQANQARGTQFIANNPLSPNEEIDLLTRFQHIYILETATIDRFSGPIFKMADSGFGLGNIDAHVADLWTILLDNFAAHFGFSVLIDQPEAPPIGVIYPSFPNSIRNVEFIQGSFTTKEDCLAEDWVQDLLELHPGIRESI